MIKRLDDVFTVVGFDDDNEFPQFVIEFDSLTSAQRYLNRIIDGEVTAHGHTRFRIEQHQVFVVEEAKKLNSSGPHERWHVISCSVPKST